MGQAIFLLTAGGNRDIPSAESAQSVNVSASDFTWDDPTGSENPFKLNCADSYTMKVTLWNDREREGQTVVDRSILYHFGPGDNSALIWKIHDDAGNSTDGSGGELNAFR